MESPLSPVIANFYMEAFETSALQDALYKPTLCKRYVEDTLLIWSHGWERLEEFATF